MDDKRELLRQTLATLAYRASRAFEDAPEEFADFGGVGRRPVEILAHMGDLFDWALSIASGNQRWHNSQPLPWADEQRHFFTSLAAFDEFLASAKPLHTPIERLFQGPVADALTHVGQIAMLRRLAGCPIRGENYFMATVSVGQVGPEQAAPVRPFKER
jgi:hypothetical protein